MPSGTKLSSGVAPKSLVLPEFNPALLRNLPSVGERTRVVDQWMLQRIKQAQRTSHSIDQRLDVLHQAGAGVQKMIASLRERLAEVSPAVSKLNDAQQRAKAQADEVLGAIEPVEQKIHEMAGQVRAKIAEIVQQNLPGEVEPLLASFKDEVRGSLESAAQSLHEQLNVAKTTAARAGEQLQEDFRSEMERLREKVKRDLIPLESDAHQRLNDQIQMHHQQVQSLIHSAAASTWEEARGVTEKIMRQAGDFASGVETRLKSAEQRAEQMTSELEARLDRAHSRAETLATTIDEAIDNAVKTVEVRVEEVLVPVRQTIDGKLDEFRTKLAGDIASAEAYLGERTGESERALVNLARAFETRVTESLESFSGGANQVVERAANQIQSFADEVSRHGETAVAPAVEKLDAARTKLEAKLAKASDELASAARKRAEELAVVGQSVVETVDQTLNQRLEALRPRAAQLFEKSIANFRAHTSDALDETMKVLVAGQSSLAEQLLTTREAQRGVLSDIEQALRDNVAHLERQAEEMTRLLEQRLAERVQAVVQNSRRTLEQATAGVTRAGESNETETASAEPDADEPTSTENP